MNDGQNYRDLQNAAEVAAEVFGEMSQEHVAALMVAANAYKQYLQSLYGADNE
jgi:hypothetical protein